MTCNCDRTVNDSDENAANEATETVEREPSIEPDAAPDEAVEDEQPTREAFAELKERNLRLIADLANSRRRMERDLIAERTHANSKMAMDLFSVVDDFDRLIDQDGGGTVLEGARLIHQKFMTAMAKHGITPVETASGDKFDPGIHDALAAIASPDREPDLVDSIVARGWRLHDRVLCGTQVIVTKAADPAPRVGDESATSTDNDNGIAQDTSDTHTEGEKS